MCAAKDGSGKLALMDVRKGTDNPSQVLAPHWSRSENPKLKQSAEGSNSKYGVLLIINCKRLAVNYRGVGIWTLIGYN